MEPTSSPEATVRSHHSARRRLIRGAFSAPAALTLYSGSSFAATSITSCVRNRVSNPVDPADTASATSDQYLRVQTRVLVNGPVTYTFVSGADLFGAASLTNSSQSFLGSNLWYCLTVVDTGTSPSAMFIANSLYTDSYVAGFGSPTPVPNKFVAIRVDANGKVVGVTNTANASAVARSCWTSFARTL